jgi:hypothetical protein
MFLFFQKGRGKVEQRETHTKGNVRLSQGSLGRRAGQSNLNPVGIVNINKGFRPDITE